MAESGGRRGISVLTACLNAADHIGDAISSTARQDVDLEHVVQDGGSTDGTVQVLESAPTVDWRSEPDRGQSDALNKAFARSSGDWIAWLNADEFYLPGGLRAMEASAESSGADVVYGTIAHVDGAGRFTGFGSQHRYSRFALSRVAPYIASCALLIRRDRLPAAPWDVDLRMTMDWDLYLTLAEGGATFRHVPYPVAAFRSHPGQVTADPGAAWAEAPTMLRKHSIAHSSISKWVGRVWDEALWVSGGRLRRRAPARTMRGADLRWFRDDVGDGPVRELMARCYPSSAVPPR